jgi:dTDP-4-amino-4,6-dideoxygalactose transaminase
MAAILCNIQSGDEVIVPSYTFVSTALAFVRQGANVVFADSYDHHPNIDANKLEQLITSRTRAIVPVHYAGVACDMDKIMLLADKYKLFVIEDAAQAIDSYYKGKALGSIGHLATFSFHESKNIISGEGGLLAINDEQFLRRSEIIWEKGTNRAEFFRGEVNKYGWIDIGSSFLPSELIAAFLWAQIENMDDIQVKRKKIWNTYYEYLKPLSAKGYFTIPEIPVYATNNAHIFYMLCNSLEEREKLLSHLKFHDVLAVFHYLSLHCSPFYKNKHDGRELNNSDHFSDCLVRLPLYYELGLDQTIKIANLVIENYE